ncbi:hypothetical protein J6590_059167 [Homalodisca vitripennis]|nr:hypothetical protein J6590_059167 [Homalodisca vitripennis]
MTVSYRRMHWCPCAAPWDSLSPRLYSRVPAPPGRSATSSVSSVPVMSVQCTNPPPSVRVCHKIYLSLLTELEGLFNRDFDFLYNHAVNNT